MTDDTGFFLEPKRRWTWQWWLILGLVGLLLLAAGGLALMIGIGNPSSEPAAVAAPTMTLVPTFTPRPLPTEAPPTLALSVRPWTDDGGPVGLVEVTLSLPASAHVTHEPPPGFRYWRGDLLPTREGWGWSGAGAGEVRWYLLREPDAALPATLEVTVDGQALAVTLEAGVPATASAPVE